MPFFVRVPKYAAHFSFEVKDEDIISPYCSDNEDIWQGDAVELFLSPDGDRTRYFELEVSPFGVRFWGEVINRDGKTPRLKTSAHVRSECGAHR